jgi:hypothetical protein
MMPVTETEKFHSNKYFRIFLYMPSTPQQLRRMKTLFFLLCLLFAQQLSAQPWTLQYKVPSGTSWKYKQTEKMNALAQTNDGRSTQMERKTTRYMTLEIESASNAGLQYIFRLDTAVVEDNEASSRLQQTDFENILTRKPVRVVLAPSGKVESTTPLEPLRVEARLGIAGGDAMFAQRAAILPALPSRELKPGDTWIETTSDTLYPSKEAAGVGRGSGLRILANATRYIVEGMESKRNIPCLLLRWESTVQLEEKIIYPSLEEYTEDNTVINGTMYVAIDSGMPIDVTIRSERENTRALFGNQNTVIPSSITTFTTLEFIPQ